MTHSSSVLSYEHLSFEVKPRGRPPRRLIDDISVQVKAGELLAIMASQQMSHFFAYLLPRLTTSGTFRGWASLPGASVTLNGRPLDAAAMHSMSVFVETDDALLGVLTVRESITYSLRLYAPSLSRKEVTERVNRVIVALGLASCAENRIGTALFRGISNGQKRRTVAACAMVTYPRILFLDEVTSGLDSTCAEQVLAAIKALAVDEGMIVLASIHQPSMATLSYFTNLLMLSGGKECYYGTITELNRFFTSWGHPVPPTSTPPEYAMYFLNDDFEVANTGLGRAEDMREYYLSIIEKSQEDSTKSPVTPNGFESQDPGLERLIGRKLSPAASYMKKTAILSERTTKNFVRNLSGYGVRIGVYAGMGILVGTICLRLSLDDSTIPTRLALHFVTIAFLSFASAAGVPAFLEERAVFVRESKNGLYTTSSFVIANTVVNTPFLFSCTALYCCVCYWLINLNPSASAFFRFIGITYLAVIVGESQMFFLASLCPILMITLAIGSTINGLWMGISGYLIKAESLPRFWYYTFHHVNFMKYSIELLANSDLRGVTFTCKKVGNRCHCSYPIALPSTCSISGDLVLEFLEIRDISMTKWVGVLIGLFAFYRLAMYVTLIIRKK